MSNPTDLQKMARWFEVPIHKLEHEIKDGDAAFVALATGLMLFERYFRILSGSQGVNEVDAALQKASEVLDIDVEFLKSFWKVYRHGLAHNATPQATRRAGIQYKWLIGVGPHFKEYPTCFKHNGDVVICLDPWAFTRSIITRIKNDTTHFAQSLPSYTFASISPNKLTVTPKAFTRGTFTEANIPEQP